jgi:predicted nucleic acid-binding protein
VIVIDASVLTNAFTDDGALGGAARAELRRDAHWVSAAHLYVETFSAIRGRRLADKITERRARAALAAVAQTAIDLVDTAALFPRMWELRRNISGYDAACVAAAEQLDCALVTADDRLARSAGIRCEVRCAMP